MPGDSWRFYAFCLLTCSPNGILVAPGFWSPAECEEALHFPEPGETREAARVDEFVLGVFDQQGHCVRRCGISPALTLPHILPGA